jgi:hypothetical protein
MYHITTNTPSPENKRQKSTSPETVGGACSAAQLFLNFFFSNHPE